MLSIYGYYDGQAFVPLDSPLPEMNQKVIITYLDEFVKPNRDDLVRRLADMADDACAREILQAIEDSEGFEDCERIDEEEPTTDEDAFTLGFDKD